jgi:type 1 glutamine amidotransferase
VTKRILVLSRGDKWHNLEGLGARIEKWAQALTGIRVEVSHDRSILGTGALEVYDACVLCTTMEDLTDAEEGGLARYVAGGRGVVGIHSATVTDEERETYIDLIGARFEHHPPYASFDVRVIAPDHAVVAGLGVMTFSDELYVLDRAPRNAIVLATAEWQERVRPMIYVKPYGKGRVLYIALGHDQATYGHPAFRQLVMQGLAWACDAG